MTAADSTTQSERAEECAEPFRRTGYWWRTMGLTRTHLIGVFITEGVLVAIGGGLLAVSFTTDSGNPVQLLLAAACAFLVQVGVVLSSILSLLFYLGARVDALAATLTRRNSQDAAVR